MQDIFSASNLQDGSLVMENRHTKCCAFIKKCTILSFYISTATLIEDREDGVGVSLSDGSYIEPC